MANTTISLAEQPMDIRAGTESVLAQMVAAFDAAKPQCAYQCANSKH